MRPRNLVCKWTMSTRKFLRVAHEIALKRWRTGWSGEVLHKLESFHMVWKVSGRKVLEKTMMESIENLCKIFILRTYYKYVTKTAYTLHDWLIHWFHDFEIPPLALGLACISHQLLSATDHLSLYHKEHFWIILTNFFRPAVWRLFCFWSSGTPAGWVCTQSRCWVLDAIGRHCLHNRSTRSTRPSRGRRLLGTQQLHPEQSWKGDAQRRHRVSLKLFLLKN